MSDTPTSLELPPEQSPTPSSLSGVNVLLMGPAGTGKTHSIGTLVDTGIEVFYLALESGLESLLGYYTDRNLPIPSNLHWHHLAAPAAGFESLMDAAKKINMLSFESLTKLSDPNRTKYTQFVGLLETLSNFPDDRTGQKFGAIDSWGPERAIVIDGLTGIGLAAMSNVIGGKPVKNQADWGVAQDQVERLLRMLCDNCRCHFVLLSHVEREIDQVLGGTKITVSTLGRALSPKIPSLFSDVILTTRAADKWTWDTASAMADVKTRNLPLSANNLPSFGPIIAQWRKRQTAAGTMPPSVGV